MLDVPGRLAHLVPEHTIRFAGHDTHSHDVPHLVYVAAGAADLVIDGQPMSLRVHESVWMAAGVPHSARYAAGSLVLGPTLSATTVPNERVQRLGTVPAVTSVMTAILGAAPSTPEQIQVFRAALDDVLTTLTGPYLRNVAPTHKVAAAVGRRARYSGETLAELAAAHHVSTRQIQRIFVAETGLTFGRWRSRERLNVAIGRLRDGDSMARAARKAGYQTTSGLVKAMTRETGMDRAAWQRELLDGSEG